MGTPLIVRISKAKGLLEKGYHPSRSEELFKVVKIAENQTPIMYNLVDLQGERIEGGSYEPEFQAVTEPDTYWVEKVIETSTRRGQKEY